MLRRLLKVAQNKYLLILLFCVFIVLFIINSSTLDRIWSRYINSNIISIRQNQIYLDNNCFQSRIAQRYFNGLVYGDAYLENAIIEDERCENKNCAIHVKLASDKEVELLNSGMDKLVPLKLTWGDLLMLKKNKSAPEENRKMFYSQTTHLLLFANSEKDLECIKDIKIK